MHTYALIVYMDRYKIWSTFSLYDNIIKYSIYIHIYVYKNIFYQYRIMRWLINSKYNYSTSTTYGNSSSNAGGREETTKLKFT